MYFAIARFRLLFFCLKAFSDPGTPVSRNKLFLGWSTLKVDAKFSENTASTKEFIGITERGRAGN
jgi:hypothetical protein